MNTWTYIDGVLTLTYIFEEGGFDIQADLCGTEKSIKLYEIPNFGGERRFMSDHEDIVDAIKAGRQLT